MNGENRWGLRYWAEFLFFMLPFLASAYIARVLVPAASRRWPARFFSWQESLLLLMVIALPLVCVRPLYRLMHGQNRQEAGMNGVSAVLSLFALTGGAVATLLHLNHWIVGMSLVGAAMPPVLISLAGKHKDADERRFNL